MINYAKQTLNYRLFFLSDVRNDYHITNYPKLKLGNCLRR